MPVMNPPTAGTPVHSLQRMLRTLTSVHREIPLLSPDGIFGEETLEAVMIFQRLMGLPVNRTVDQRTWDALVEEHHQGSHLLAPPRPAALFPTPCRLFSGRIRAASRCAASSWPNGKGCDFT